MDQISQIKQKLDVVDVVGGYVALKKSGKNYKGLCPFHGENTPSFMVSPELQMYKCFGCAESGDIFSFVQKIEGIDFSAALEVLAERAGIKLEKANYDPDAALKKQLYWVNEQAAKFYNYILTKNPAGKPGLDYLRLKRKLSDRVINEFLLGYAPEEPATLFNNFTKKGIEPQLLLKAGLVIQKEDKSYLDKYRGRITFPFMGIDGKVLGFTARTVFDREPKYLNSPETPVFSKSFFLYGLNVAKVAIKKSGAVFVEGQMDVVSAHEAGFSNVIASSGTSLTQGQLKMVGRYTSSLTFCFDTDKAGVSAAFRGIELAENLGFNINVASIPLGYKDIDELLKKAPNQARDVLEKAVPAYDFLLYMIIKRYNKNSSDGKKKIMDELLPWFKRIKSTVLLDHYTKEIASELNLNEGTVSSLLQGNMTSSQVENAREDLAKEQKASSQPLESYIMTLLLKGDLDFMQSMGYKVEPQDIEDKSLRSLLVSLQEYIKSGVKNFDPKKFKTLLDGKQAEIFENLYLHEVLITEPVEENLSKEFDSVLLRLKRTSARKNLHKISEQIKIAEKSEDTTTLKTLTKEFETLKNQLLDA